METKLHHVVFGCLVVLALGLLLMGHILLGLAALSMATGMIASGWKEIPQKHKGLPTFWGKRLEHEKPHDEGKKWLADYFPFYIGVVPVEVTRFVDDYEIPEVACNKEGTDKLEEESPKFQFHGTIGAKVSFIAKTNSKKLKEFQDHGGKDAVKKTIGDIITATVRSLGTHNTWMNMVAKKDLVTLKVVEVLTGEVPAKNETIVNFLSRMSAHGFEDKHSLGTIFYKINLEKLLPEGNLRTAAEKVAVEEQERASDKADAETGIELALKAKNELGLQPKDAANYMQAERGRAKKVIVEAPPGMRTFAVSPGFFDDSDEKKNKNQHNPKQNNNKKKGGDTK